MHAFSVLIALSLSIPCAAFAGPLHDAARQGDAAAMRDLLDSGADANELAIMTPLQMAALNGQLEAVELLIGRGADLNASSSIIGSALHAAAQRGHTDIIAALLGAGADPDARNNYEFTPIMIASMNGSLDTVGALIDGGADPNAIGTGRSTSTGGDGDVNALHLAAFHGHWDVYQALEQAGAQLKLFDQVEERMRTADPIRGRDLAMKFCGNCHIVESTSEIITNDSQGLSLIGVFGRPIASLNDFGYSEALQRAGGVWNADMLYSYSVNAKLTIPGTRMQWNDGWNEEDALHIVAYFASVAE